MCFKVAFCRTGKKNCWCQNETSGKPECLGGFFEFRGTAMKTEAVWSTLSLQKKNHLDYDQEVISEALGKNDLH